MMIVLRPQGNLDLVGAATLQQKVERVANFAAVTQKTWVIDLARVNGINHFGLTALVAARRYAKDKGCRLFLRNLKPPVQLMLEIAQLNQDFEILDDVSSSSEASSQSSSKVTSSDQKTQVSIEISQDRNSETSQEETSSVLNLQRILSSFKSRFSESTT
jgi:anti-sigma B factor antagonist